MLANLSIAIVTFLEVVLGPAILAAALIYGIVFSRKRGEALRQLTEVKTRELYRRGANEERSRND